MATIEAARRGRGAQRAQFWDDQGDGRVSGGSMEESSTMYAVVADAHDVVLRDLMKDSL